MLSSVEKNKIHPYKHVFELNFEMDLKRSEQSTLVVLLYRATRGRPLPVLGILSEIFIKKTEVLSTLITRV